MKLQIESVKEPPVVTRKYKYAPISLELLNANVGQWLKISGFENEDKIRCATRSFYSGERCLAKKLTEYGLKLELRSSYAELALYVRKVEK